jgi:hypothetical protein
MREWSSLSKWERMAIAAVLAACGILTVLVTILMALAVMTARFHNP